MSETFELSPGQRDEFDRRGVLRLPEFYALDAVDAMADRVWEDLAIRFGIRRDQPESWGSATPGKFQGLRKSGAFDGLQSPEMRDLADALLGAGAWDAPAHWGGLLVSFPTSGPTLGRPPWHLDIGGVEHLSPLPVLRVFTFLEAAPPGGGGTLYVAGSHLLAMEVESAQGGPVRSAQVRERLRAEYPWFAHLLTTPHGDLSKLKDVEATLGGHSVRLEQMTGDPGDLIIMHPAILHGTAHNGLDRPRIMLTEWIVRRGAIAAPWPA